MFKKGHVVGIVKLKNTYDAYATMVLGDYLERVEEETESKRRPPAKYTVLKPTPSPSEYQLLKTQRFTVSAESLVSDAQSSCEDLANEMREWYDNLTEGLQQTEKADRINEAADLLEGLDFDVPKDVEGVLQHITAFHPPMLNCNSRADRASDASDMLINVKDAIEEWVEENRPEGQKTATMTFGEGDDKEEVEVDFDALSEFADHLDELSDEIQSVEFPGMYG